MYIHMCGRLFLTTFTPATGAASPRVRESARGGPAGRRKGWLRRSLLFL